MIDSPNVASQRGPERELISYKPEPFENWNLLHGNWLPLRASISHNYSSEGVDLPGAITPCNTGKELKPNTKNKGQDNCDHMAATNAWTLAPSYAMGRVSDPSNLNTEVQEQSSEAMNSPHYYKPASFSSWGWKAPPTGPQLLSESDIQSYVDHYVLHACVCLWMCFPMNTIPNLRDSSCRSSSLFLLFIMGSCAVTTKKF